jgi:hypothetical protein
MEEIRKAILADLVGSIETSMGSCVVETTSGEIEYKWRNGGTSEIEIEQDGERRLVTFEVDVRVETIVQIEA